MITFFVTPDYAITTRDDLRTSFFFGENQMSILRERGIHSSILSFMLSETNQVAVIAKFAFYFPVRSGH